MRERSVALDVKNISMQFRMLSEKVDSFKEYFIKKVKLQLEYKSFQALKDVSFQVFEGEVFGIIGLNGAGKSTLLKIISGILKPTDGKIYTRGSIAPLIELGAGFNGDLSGKENIILNGLLLGFSRRYLIEKMDEIIAFSELEEFIHVPLKNYSSGMKARLGFSIATSVQPDLLIVDEILSVGDTKFKKKCEHRIRTMINSGTSVLFVSHSLGQVSNLCERVLWLEKGCVRKIGNAVAVCKEFEEAAV